MIDVGGGYLDIPAVENGGFQDDRCPLKPISIFVGNGQSLKLASSLCEIILPNYFTVTKLLLKAAFVLFFSQSVCFIRHTG